MIFFVTPSITVAKDAKVVLLKGEAFAIRDHKKYILKKDEFLHDGDEIITKASSLLKILMNDQSVLTLGPHGHLKFHEIDHTNPKLRKSTFKLFYGMLRNLVNKSGGKHHYQVKTKQVSLGVRGTEFIVEVLNIEDEHHSKVALLSGSLDMHSRSRNPKKRKSFKLKKHHHFNSHIYHKKGFEEAHQKLDKHHLKHLKENPHSFIHDVHHPGKPHPEYKHPDYIKKHF